MNTEKLVLQKENEQVSAVPDGAASSPTGSWGGWCDWLGRNLKGIAACMERVDNPGTCTVDFQNWPLLAIRAHRLENGVNAISLTFAVNNHERRFEITGVHAIQLECDAAGLPTVAEFVTESERVVLRFTERPRATPIYSGNSWGE